MEQENRKNLTKKGSKQSNEATTSRVSFYGSTGKIYETLLAGYVGIAADTLFPSLSVFPSYSKAFWENKLILVTKMR